MTHHAKLSADAMVGKALELWETSIWLQAAGTIVDSLDEAEALLESGDVYALRAAALTKHGSVDVPPKEDPGAWQQMDAVTPYDLAGRTVREALENEIAMHGDDGLLEMLATSSHHGLNAPATAEPQVSGVEIGVNSAATTPVAQPPSLSDEAPTAPARAAASNTARATLIADLRRQSAQLADDLLGRRLYKKIGRVGLADAPAKRLFDVYGSAAKRVGLQDKTQRWLGLDASPQVLLWLPDTKMRLKLAEVLVDDGEHVDLFVDYERARSGRGSEIYDAHARLWACYVYADPDLAANDIRRRLVLAYLARELGVCWEAERDTLGPAAGEWVDRAILGELSGLEPMDPSITDLMHGRRQQLAARSPGDSYAAEHVELKLIYDDSGTPPTSTT